MLKGLAENTKLENTRWLKSNCLTLRNTTAMQSAVKLVSETCIECSFLDGLFALIFLFVVLPAFIFICFISLKWIAVSSGNDHTCSPPTARILNNILLQYFDINK